jgi:hypothetical protein
MPRRPCHFRQHDVTAAIKAAVKAGVQNYEVVVDTSGSIRIIVGKAGAADDRVDDLDRELQEWEARHGRQG